MPDALIDSLIRSNTAGNLPGQADFKILSKSNQGLYELSSKFRNQEDSRSVNPLVKTYSGRLNGQDSSINKVDLSNSTLNANDLTVMGDALSNHRESESVCFAKCKLGDRFGATLIGLLQPKPSIKNLDLRANQLSISSISALIDLMKNHQELESLDLSYNFIGDIGFLKLFDAIKAHPNLKTVALVYCGLSSKSRKSIHEWRNSSAFATSKEFITG